MVYVIIVLVFQKYSVMLFSRCGRIALPWPNFEIKWEHVTCFDQLNVSQVIPLISRKAASPHILLPGPAMTEASAKTEPISA